MSVNSAYHQNIFEFDANFLQEYLYSCHREHALILCYFADKIDQSELHSGWRVSLTKSFCSDYPFVKRIL